MDHEAIRSNYERKRRLLEARPGAGRESASSTLRMRAGETACDITSGPHTVRADYPSPEGGGTGPTPGQMMRNALAACLAIGYRLWSVRLGIPVGAIDVDMTCDIDARGQLGVGEDVPARWQRIAYAVRITSDAPEEEVRRLVDHADRLSPMLDCLDKAIARERTLEVRRSA